MSGRNEILKKLRRAVPAEKAIGYSVPSDETVFADYPDTKEKMKALFAERLKQLHGELINVRDEAGAGEALEQLLGNFPDQSCLAYPPELMEKLTVSNPGLMNRFTGDFNLDLDSPAFAQFSAGITNADFLVARSGSIILTAATAGGRRLSVLPPVHIVIAYAGQIVPSLDSAINKLPDSSYITIITGPSRTSDIEKKLVLGAHGPKRLAVILIG